jgi:hypothetical protein
MQTHFLIIRKHLYLQSFEVNMRNIYKYTKNHYKRFISRKSYRKQIIFCSLVLATFLWAFYDLSDGRSCIKIFLKKTLYEFLRNLKYLIIKVRVSPTFVVSLVARNLMGKHNKLMVAMSTI